MKRIRIFSGFIEEGSTSMFFYSSQIVKLFKESNTHNLIPESYYARYSLSFLSSIIGNINVFRINKYFIYPIKAFWLKKDINHIIDHTNAQLLFFLWNRKTIVTVHDLIPLLIRNGKIIGMHKKRNPLLFKISLFFLKKATKIVAVSVNTKNDLIKYCSISPDKIEVIYNGVNPGFKKIININKSVEKRRIGINDFNSVIILLVGSLEYKNHHNALIAIKKLEDNYKYNIQVVILKASSFDLYVQPEQYKLNKQILILSNLSLSELVYLYNISDCLLFPSFYEGFAWPPIEAIACGTPVIVSDIPVLRETISDIGIFVNPNEVNSIQNGINHVIKNKSYLESSLLENSKVIQERFSHDLFTRNYISLYNSL